MLFGSPALANILVTFNESAPKDWFEISNQSQCELESLQLSIHLEDSKGRLIFDTRERGQGLEVFQPFEVREGSISLESGQTVDDGDTSLTITVQRLSPGNSASFTIDVDDRLSVSELGNIRVSDAEIAGGIVILETAAGETSEAKFNNQGNTLLMISPCD